MRKWCSVQCFGKNVEYLSVIWEESVVVSVLVRKYSVLVNVSVNVFNSHGFSESEHFSLF